MGGDAPVLAKAVDLLVGLRFEVHDGWVGPKEVAQVGPYGLLVGAHLGLLQDQCGIQVSKLVARLVHELHLILEII